MIPALARLGSMRVCTGIEIGGGWWLPGFTGLDIFGHQNMEPWDFGGAKSQGQT